jgi:hypothetical protein
VSIACENDKDNLDITDMSVPLSDIRVEHHFIPTVV